MRKPLWYETLESIFLFHHYQRSSLILPVCWFTGLNQTTSTSGTGSTGGTGGTGSTTSTGSTGGTGSSPGTSLPVLPVPPVLDLADLLKPALFRTIWFYTIAENPSGRAYCLAWSTE
jgi:hypothetical protein